MVWVRPAPTGRWSVTAIQPRGCAALHPGLFSFPPYREELRLRATRGATRIERLRSTRGARRIVRVDGLALLVELVLHADGDAEVDIGLGDIAAIVDGISGKQRVRGNAEGPVRGAVQVDVAADDGCRSDLVVIEIHNGWGVSMQVSLEFSIRPADQDVSDERTMLVVRPEPLGSRGKDVLLDEWPSDVERVWGRAAGAQKAAPGAFQGPMLAEPV